MGASQSKDLLYAVPVSEPKAGETAIYRNSEHKENLLVAPKSGFRTMQDLYLRNFKEHASSEFLGFRPSKGVDKDPKSKKNVQIFEERFEYLKWNQIETQAKAIGSAIENLGLAPVRAQYKDYKLRFVGIHSKNTTHWILLDIANMLYGYTTVALYDTLGEEAVDFMLNDTELSTLFISADQVKKHCKRIKSGAAPHLKNLVIMDDIVLDEADLKELEGINWYRWSQILVEGHKEFKPYPKVVPEDILCFSYTSGTTGLPKGVMISNKNMLALLAGAEDALTYLNSQSVYLSYLPLAHVLEKIVFGVLSLARGKYSLFAGDVFKLKDDIAILKPTLFVSVPRLFNKFHDTIRAKLGELTGCKSTLAKRALNVKLSNVDSGKYTHTVYDSLVFNKMKGFLGGRVEVMLSGSAPLSLPVKKFMKACFSCPFIEGYGQTEGIGGEFVQSIHDSRLDSVGGPLAMNEFKLIDVPEMKYTSKDVDEFGRLAPRGEILVRGANVITGYYKNEEKTKESIDDEGWLHSGDIGIILPGSNALKIIDRRKNIFKLSQGEYVAPDRLEQVYKTTPGIADIFVYGDSLKSNLVAIANLNEPDALKLANEKGIEAASAGDLIANPQFNKLMLDKLRKVADDNSMKGFERVIKVHFDLAQFADNDLVTTTFKLKRNEAKDFYKSVIDKLYEDLD
jgi:long-chain acyl-CoA synthetase